MQKKGQKTRYSPFEDEDQYSGYKRVVIVRNPFDRLVSLYSNRNSNGNLLASLGYGLEDLSVYNKSFEYFVDKICSIPDELSDRHFRSQYCQIKDPDIILKFEDIGKVETTLRSLFPLFDFEMPHANKSNRGKNWEDYYNIKAYKMVANRFKTDLEVFNYGS